ncbi:MAG: thiamine biosynthesis protein ThiF [Oscillospiraceae bacterium]|nr:thiamine biosynthesis protein ThiF [Oscillospiraceae bacterium]
MLPTQEEWNAALRRRHGAARQQKFAAATVAVCGLGGLGSNIAIALARSGVGRLLLIDFDRVELSNLHRQQYRAAQIGMYKTEAMGELLREIAPWLSFEAVTERITAGNAAALLAGADVVCEAFDGAEAKAMLVNAVLEQLPGTCLVAASGMAGLGSPNTIRTRKITEKLYLCGDEVSDVAGAGSLVAPRVMLCAVHQALTVLRLLAGESDV